MRKKDTCKENLKRRTYTSPKIDILFVETEGDLIIASIHNTQNHPTETWLDGGEETQEGYW
ncbi:MAG: hypothetical protein QM654_06070 [Dysgonamonadaceae bacterium]